MASAPPPAELWLESVVELLDRQRSLFRELDALSVEQSGHVGSGDTERLLGVLARKQSLIERVQEVSVGLQPFMAEWAQKVAALPERSRVLLRTRTDELETLATSVQVRDDADRAALESQSRVIGVELASAAKAQGASRAYSKSGGSGGPMGPRFQDRQG